MALFPNALVIHISRDMFANAQSILAARMATNGNYDEWWSLPPSEKAELENLKPEQQVVGQIAAINEQISNDVERLGLKSRVLSIAYEEMCSDPNGFVVKVKEFAAKGGVTLSKKEEVPSKFQIRTESNLPTHLLNALRVAVKSKESH